MLSQEAIEKLRRLMVLREARDEAKAALSRAEEEYREAEAEIHEELSEGALDRLNNVDLGPPWGKVSFHAKATTYGRVVDSEQARAFFEGQQMGDVMTEPKFVGARINEIVRDAEEQGEELPPGLDYYKRRYIQITRQKG